MVNEMVWRCYCCFHLNGEFVKCENCGLPRERQIIVLKKRQSPSSETQPRSDHQRWENESNVSPDRMKGERATRMNLRQRQSPSSETQPRSDHQRWENESNVSPYRVRVEEMAHTSDETSKSSHYQKNAERDRPEFEKGGGFGCSTAGQRTLKSHAASEQMRSTSPNKDVKAWSGRSGESQTSRTITSSKQVKSSIPPLEEIVAGGKRGSSPPNKTKFDIMTQQNLASNFGDSYNEMPKEKSKASHIKYSVPGRRRGSSPVLNSGSPKSNL